MPLESLNINGVAVDTCINYLTSVLTCVLFLPSLNTSVVASAVPMLENSCWKLPAAEKEVQ